MRAEVLYLRALAIIAGILALLLTLGTFLSVWGLRDGVGRLADTLTPSETVLAGGSTPVSIRKVPTMTFEKTLDDGTVVTFECPRNPGEDTKDWAERCKAEWKIICDVLEG